jgi:hypothetical protein
MSGDSAWIFAGGNSPYPQLTWLKTYLRNRFVVVRAVLENDIIEEFVVYS